MKFTIGWLKEHLDTKFKDSEIIEKLTDVGLEVESFEKVSSDLDNFKVAKIINAEQHPNADKLKVCDVDIGEQDTVKVVCGAPNAKKDLLTVYAGPGSVIPKNNMKLAISKIRGVTSYGMLCSESELNLSDESHGRINIKNNKYQTDNTPLDPNCSNLNLNKYSKNYLNHLFNTNEILASMLLTLHNINFYQELMSTIRKNISEGTFDQFYDKYIDKL